MQAKLDTLHRAFTIDCAACDERRLEDLARALDQRLAGFSGDTDAMRRLVLVALSLLDEAQATSAALVRARTEIERLTDMVVEAKLEAASAPDTSDRGRIQALRATHGLA